jgi:hypothetical protein
MADQDASPSSPIASPTLSQAHQALNGLRLSGDSERSNATSPPPAGVNGTKEHVEDGGEGDPLEQLQRELQRTRDEKETLATQYRNLLSKLTNMRTTLGTKLQQDAVRTSL